MCVNFWLAHCLPYFVPYLPPYQLFHFQLYLYGLGSIIMRIICLRFTSKYSRKILIFNFYFYFGCWHPTRSGMPINSKSELTSKIFHFLQVGVVYYFNSWSTCLRCKVWYCRARPGSLSTCSLATLMSRPGDGKCRQCSTASLRSTRKDNCSVSWKIVTTVNQLLFYLWIFQSYCFTNFFIATTTLVNNHNKSYFLIILCYCMSRFLDSQSTVVMS